MGREGRGSAQTPGAEVGGTGTLGGRKGDTVKCHLQLGYFVLPSLPPSCVLGFDPRAQGVGEHSAADLHPSPRGAGGKAAITEVRELRKLRSAQLTLVVTPLFWHPWDSPS